MLLKNGGVESQILIEVEHVLPGMEDFEDIIEVTNRGEVGAKLEYTIQSVKIMDEYYEIDEENGITSETLENKMKQDYPFKINIEKEVSNLGAEFGKVTFRITVTWPYESGDDIVDTEWGNKAYEFYKNNPDEKCIEIKMILKAIQSIE